MSRSNRGAPTVTLEEKQIEEIADRVCTNFVLKIEKKFDEKFKSMEKKLDSYIAKINNLQSSVQDNSNFIKHIENRVEVVENACKKNTLRLDGVGEEEKEDILQVVLVLINSKLKIKCEESDINDIYRIGRQNMAHPRTIVIKFGSFLKRNSVYNAKKSLKGTGMFVNEDLSKNQYGLLKAAKKKYGNKQVWSANGRIMCISDNEIKAIKSLDNL